jgi:hypothetical protein
MQGPEGRPPNVSPARKGWEFDSEEDASAVGAALNRSSALPVSLTAKPRDLQFLGPLLETRNSMLKQNCHLDRRSHGPVAHQGDEKRFGPATTFYGTVALSFVIPSEAEGSAVPRTFRGNVFLQSVAQWRDLRFLVVPTQTLKPS